MSYFDFVNAFTISFPSDLLSPPEPTHSIHLPSILCLEPVQARQLTASWVRGEASEDESMILSYWHTALKDHLKKANKVRIA